MSDSECSPERPSRARRSLAFVAKILRKYQKPNLEESALKSTLRECIRTIVRVLEVDFRPFSLPMGRWPM